MPILDWYPFYGALKNTSKKSVPSKLGSSSTSVFLSHLVRFIEKEIGKILGGKKKLVQISLV
jgi:hypothetical protein